VMNRRKSVVNPSGFGEKKHRSPFASFKRGESREAPIPESSSGADRPGTALTTQESYSDSMRQPSESHEREGLGTASSGFSQPAPVPATTNGTASQEVSSATGIANTAVNDVSLTVKLLRLAC
jgi:hypothetical protein